MRLKFFCTACVVLLAALNVSASDQVPDVSAKVVVLEDAAYGRVHGAVYDRRR